MNSQRDTLGPARVGLAPGGAAVPAEPAAPALESTSPTDAASLSRPAAPHPIDGSQFHNVIEEQYWSELPPTPEEQQPHRKPALPEPSHDAPPDAAPLSVGPV